MGFVRAESGGRGSGLCVMFCSVSDINWWWEMERVDEDGG